MNNPIEHLADKIADALALEGQRVRAELAAGLADTVNGLRVTAARPQPIGANALNSTSAGRLVGWSLKESAAAPAPAVVTIYNGRDTGSDVLAVIPLAAGGGATILPHGSGVSFGDGLYVAVAGSVTGSLYFGSVD